MKKSYLFFLLITFIFMVTTADAQFADSVKKDTAPTAVKIKYSLHKPGTYLPPVILVSYGVLSFVVTPIRHVDYYFKERIQRSDPDYSSKIDDYLQIAPGVLVYGLNLVGIEGKNRFVDRTALLALSAGILTITDGTKYIAHRKRPYGTDPLSFPSGHTGAAFVAAEFLAQEYAEKSPWYGVLGYTIASTTGVLRLYGKAHWFSDCVAGAGLGILSTKLAYVVYPYIRSKLTHKDKYGRSTMIMPTYQDGTPGLSFAMQL
ncbi:phosphatase PAP2 family protein [Mucilaginibacter gotjawali]|uniref:Lipid A 1-phosphatase n=2 Tax=Mucilaginibacter gotjawali TaxID=1550579 RepID=A0A0X8X349_9SPHI|nr:phosphatase PAP2 family protein [Mucilaginibacter gotjawali]MBB3058189.1 membrane-associated phospholipid phosphatase [Mucilaginibacter gotjawali]BAU54855.1 lipid A 1-phosphatase [Mucilaginibacter gotjawali]